MNLSHLKNEELLNETIALSEKVRQLTTKLLHYLKEIESRRIYAELGYSSLFDFAMRHLKFSSGEAHLRISAMRATKDIPEVAKKIESGELSLSVVAQTQSFIKQQNIQDIDQKKELFRLIEGQTTREAERTLAALLPEGERKKSRLEERRLLDQVFDHETQALLEQLIARFSNQKPKISYNELVKEIAKIALDQTDPTKPKRYRFKRTQNGASTPRTRTLFQAPKVRPKRKSVSAKVKRLVWARDEGQCTYKDPKTNLQCQTKHFLEIDHIRPIAIGGTNCLENLRLLCRTHNQLMASRNLGIQKMRQYSSS